MKSEKALLLVDIQNDFCAGGTLAVPNGDAVVAPMNKLIQLFREKGLPIFASRDWHSPQTRHFADFGGVWPAHCVQDTKGAEFHPELTVDSQVEIISKGMKDDEDGYSSFETVSSDGSAFPEIVSAREIKSLYVGGLATDYCVKATVLDALKAGIDVTVIEDGVAAVNIQEGDGERAIAEMKAAGARFILSSQVQI